MSTAVLLPVCAACRREIALPGSMVMAGDKYYHLGCTPAAEEAKPASRCVDEATPSCPSDWHARTFRDAKFWRAEADKWECLASRAEIDGDTQDAEECKRKAAGCRHNARVLEFANGVFPIETNAKTEAEHG